AGASFEGFEAGGDCYSGASFFLSLIPVDVHVFPLITDNFGEHFMQDIFWGTHFLQCDDVDIAVRKPRRHIASVSGANPVDVDGGYAKCIFSLWIISVGMHTSV